MVFENFKAYLNANPLCGGYNFKGSDIFLINKGIELVLQKASINPINVIKINSEDFNDNRLDGALRNISFFGEVAVVTRGIDYAKVAFKEFLQKREWFEVTCDPMGEATVIKLILQNKKFTPDAALALTQMTDNNFARVSGEMEKLCALYDSKPTIEKADVESTVSKTEKYQVFELSTAAFKKDIKKLDAILETLSTDTDDYAIFGNLLSVCRRLFYIKNSPLKPTDLAKSLGVHPFSIISALRDAKQVTADAAKRIYRCALDLEYDIKSGKVLANRATVLLIGEILQ